MPASSAAMRCWALSQSIRSCSQRLSYLYNLQALLLSKCVQRPPSHLFMRSHALQAAGKQRHAPAPRLSLTTHWKAPPASTLDWSNTGPERPQAVLQEDDADDVTSELSNLIGYPTPSPQDTCPDAPMPGPTPAAIQRLEPNPAATGTSQTPGGGRTDPPTTACSGAAAAVGIVVGGSGGASSLDGSGGDCGGGRRNQPLSAFLAVETAAGDSGAAPAHPTAAPTAPAAAAASPSMQPGATPVHAAAAPRFPPTPGVPSDVSGPSADVVPPRAGAGAGAAAIHTTGQSTVAIATALATVGPQPPEAEPQRQAAFALLSRHAAGPRPSAHPSLTPNTASTSVPDCSVPDCDTAHSVIPSASRSLAAPRGGGFLVLGHQPRSDLCGSADAPSTTQYSWRRETFGASGSTGMQQGAAAMAAAAAGLALAGVLGYDDGPDGGGCGGDGPWNAKQPQQHGKQFVIIQPEVEGAAAALAVPSMVAATAVVETELGTSGAAPVAAASPLEAVPPTATVAPAVTPFAPPQTAMRLAAWTALSRRSAAGTGPTAAAPSAIQQLWPLEGPPPAWCSMAAAAAMAAVPGPCARPSAGGFRAAPAAWPRNRTEVAMAPQPPAALRRRPVGTRPVLESERGHLPRNRHHLHPTPHQYGAHHECENPYPYPHRRCTSVPGTSVRLMSSTGAAPAAGPASIATASTAADGTGTGYLVTRSLPWFRSPAGPNQQSRLEAALGLPPLDRHLRLGRVLEGDWHEEVAAAGGGVAGGASGALHGVEVDSALLPFRGGAAESAMLRHFMVLAGEDAGRRGEGSDARQEQGQQQRRQGQQLAGGHGEEGLMGVAQEGSLMQQPEREGEWVLGSTGFDLEDNLQHRQLHQYLYRHQHQLPSLQQQQGDARREPWVGLHSGSGLGPEPGQQLLQEPSSAAAPEDARLLYHGVGTKDADLQGPQYVPEQQQQSRSGSHSNDNSESALRLPPPLPLRLRLSSKIRLLPHHDVRHPAAPPAAWGPPGGEDPQPPLLLPPQDQQQGQEEEEQEQERALQQGHGEQDVLLAQRSMREQQQPGLRRLVGVGMEIQGASGLEGSQEQEEEEGVRTTYSRESPLLHPRGYHRHSGAVRPAPSRAAAGPACNGNGLRTVDVDGEAEEDESSGPATVTALAVTTVAAAAATAGKPDAALITAAAAGAVGEGIAGCSPPGPGPSAPVHLAGGVHPVLSSLLLEVDVLEVVASPLELLGGITGLRQVPPPHLLLGSVNHGSAAVTGTLQGARVFAKLLVGPVWRAGSPALAPLLSYATLSRTHPSLLRCLAVRVAARPVVTADVDAEGEIAVEARRQGGGTVVATAAEAAEGAGSAVAGAVAASQASLAAGPARRPRVEVRTRRATGRLHRFLSGVTQAVDAADPTDDVAFTVLPGDPPLLLPSLPHSRGHRLGPPLELSPARGPAVLASLRLVEGDWVGLVATEWADLGNLEDMLADTINSPFRERPGWPRARAQQALLATAREVAEGLAALHAAGVVHGALKPSNVLLLSCPSDPRSFTTKLADLSPAGGGKTHTRQPRPSPVTPTGPLLQPQPPPGPMPYGVEALGYPSLEASAEAAAAAAPASPPALAALHAVGPLDATGQPVLLEPFHALPPAPRPALLTALPPGPRDADAAFRAPELWVATAATRTGREQPLGGEEAGDVRERGERIPAAAAAPLPSTTLAYAADVFAYGVLLYALVAGGLPPQTAGPAGVPLPAAANRLLLPWAAGPHDHLEGLFRRCVALNPARRPCFAEIVSELRRLEAGVAAAVTTGMGGVYS